MYILVAVLLLTATASAATLDVSPDGSIQAAIFAAHPGDVIVVRAGTYLEHLRVDKPVTLRGEGMPLLDATSSGSAITLLADGVVVEGFRIINAGRLMKETSPEAGIRVLSSNNTIKGNDISNNLRGILVQGGRNNSILDNRVAGNLEFGLKLSGSSSCRVLNNTLIDNRQNAFDDGINLWEGNYFSDFDTPGEGCIDRGVGICEHPYTLPGGGSIDARPRSSPA